MSQFGPGVWAVGGGAPFSKLFTLYFAHFCKPSQDSRENLTTLFFVRFELYFLWWLILGKKRHRNEFEKALVIFLELLDRQTKIDQYLAKFVT